MNFCQHCEDNSCREWLKADANCGPDRDCFELADRWKNKTDWEISEIEYDGIDHKVYLELKGWLCPVYVKGEYTPSNDSMVTAGGWRLRGDGDFEITSAWYEPCVDPAKDEKIDFGKLELNRTDLEEAIAKRLDGEEG